MAPLSRFAVIKEPADTDLIVLETNCIAKFLEFHNPKVEFVFHFMAIKALEGIV